MAITQNTYTGNGSNQLFSITFPYLSESDVDVYLNNILQTITTQYTFANATTIQFVTAPSNGATVLLQRNTGDAELLSTFFPGSSIKASDLNDNFDQALYIAQETKNLTVAASSGNLADGAVTSSKIADGAVTAIKISDGSIVESKLASNAVTTAKILNASVTTDKLVNDSVTTAKIADFSITASKIAAGAITSSTIVDGTITPSDLAPGTVDTALSNGAVTPAKLSTGAPSWDAAGTLSFNSGFGSVAPVFGCRAWVNFDGDTNSDINNAAYSRTGTTVTVTATAHGLAVGNYIEINVDTGTLSSGNYTITTVPDANTFTFTSGTSGATSGTLDVIKQLIRGSGNVTCVTKVGTGSWRVNFGFPMPDANYCVVGTLDDASTSGGNTVIQYESATANYFEVEAYQGANNATIDGSDFVCLAVFR